jgi:RHS repeat-associated protein
MLRAQIRLVAAALLALYLLSGAVAAYAAPGEPGDPFTGSAPAFDATPAEPGGASQGDWGVAEQRGAATYTFPIVVPPGRGDMAPALALRYSSGSPLRGGLAAGWTLSLPQIHLDRAAGYTRVPRYRASLGAASGRLVEVPDATPFPGSKAYRVAFDDTFTRFFNLTPEKSTTSWVALTADGVRHDFEFGRGASDGETRWYITRQADSFGNSVRYIWGPVLTPSGRLPIIDFSLERIEYSSNQAASLPAHAMVEFDYAPLDACVGSEVPVGAALLPGAALAVQGAQRLTAIITSVRDTPGAAWRPTRRYDLSYELHSSHLYYDEMVNAPDDPPPPSPRPQCAQVPLRYLTKIATAAYAPDGAVTNLPQTTFSYNLSDRSASGPIGGPLDNLGQPPPFQRLTISENPGQAHYGTRVGGTEGSLLDIDGDGVRDRVAMGEEGGLCVLSWQRGLLGGAFETVARKAALPTAAWQKGVRPQRYEHCTLNGQVAYRDGAAEAIRGVLGYHLMDYTGDGLIDLVTSIWATSSHGSFVPPVRLADAPAAGPVPAADNRPDPNEPAPRSPMTPEETIRIYRNTGTRSGPLFEPRPLTVPLPGYNLLCPLKHTLSPATGEELNPSAITLSSIPNYIDIDGDGFMDFVDIGKLDMQSGPLGTKDGRWCVILGTGKGSFGATIDWPVPQISFGAGSDDGYIDTATNPQHHPRRATITALLDMTGDGLPDLLVQTPQGLWAYPNTGRGFSNAPFELGLDTPLEELQTDLHLADNLVIGSDRGYRRHLLDVDGDGMLDMLIFPGDADDITDDQQRPIVRFGNGDGFMRSVELPVEWAAAKRLLIFRDGAWRLRGDFTDATGDGLADLTSWSTAGVTTILDSPGLPPAPRLLRSVDNGRGLRISFTYAPSSDPGVVARTTGASTPMPGVTWVVSATSVSAGFDTPPLRSHYRYADPMRGSGELADDEPLAEHFLGFRSTTRTVDAAPDTAARRIVREYAYDEHGAPDGRLTRERVYIATGDSFRLHSVAETSWRQHPLFGGEVAVNLRERTLNRTCLPGASEAACAIQAENVHRQELRWRARRPSHEDRQLVADPDRPLGSVAQPELYELASIQEGSGPAAGPDDQRASYRYLVRYGQRDISAIDYRVLKVETLFEETIADASGASGFAPRGRERTSYDPQTGLPLRSQTWLDATTVATITRSFDPQTGNLLSEMQPAQHAPGGSGKPTTYTYDAHKLFAATTINPLGHQVFTAHDIATGALLERRGPNSVTLPDGTRAWERETWRIDGLGRLLEHAVSFDEGAGYALVVVERSSYFDGERPARVRSERLRDRGGDLFVTVEQTQDGLGRLLESAQLMAADRRAATSYTYDGLGSIAAVETPDPRSDDGARVRFGYSRDGLGRVTAFQRPDGSGLTAAYAGLEQTIREATADGSGAATRYVYDVFGRLAEVHQELPSGDATTRYRYDARDNLREIVDADGNVTRIEHDWGDRRTAIAHGERRWRYRYDLNGNVLQRLAPNGGLTSYRYDDLDRLVVLSYPVLSAGVPDRGAAPALADALPPRAFLPVAAGGRASTQGPGDAPDLPIAAPRETLSYSYDASRNGIGRLSEVALPFGEIRYSYEARGLVAAEERSYRLTGTATLSVTQRVERSYNALGQPTASAWHDGQRWRIGYDDRGLPAAVEWLDPAGHWRQAASYTRSLAGQIRARGSAFGQQRNYSYDAVGRVVADSIAVVGQSAPIATRAYAYSGAGNLVRVDGQTAGDSAAASYRYDALQRLVAAEGPGGYRGSFSYSGAGNMLTAEVNWPGSPEARSVRYAYSAHEPQAVEKLISVDGSSYASFGYDPSGNMISRTTPQGTTRLTWDGLDHLRAAAGPSGGEVYRYDHLGMRVLAVDADGVRLTFAERETHFDTQGRQTHSYLHLSDGASAVARVANGTAIELHYADALQNLMLALDEKGAVVASFLYGAFGEIVQATGAEEHRRQFNGKEHDAATGLRYYGFRYYDPLVLRWISADPLYRLLPEIGLDNPQRLNLYSFSLNNPLRFYDPDGRDGEDGEPAEDGSQEAGCVVLEGGGDNPECVPVDEGETVDADASEDLGEQLSELEHDYQHEQQEQQELRKEAAQAKMQLHNATKILEREMKSVVKTVRKLSAAERKLSDAKKSLGKGAAKTAVKLARGCGSSGPAGCALKASKELINLGYKVYKYDQAKREVTQLRKELETHKQRTHEVRQTFWDAVGQLIDIAGRGAGP